MGDGNKLYYRVVFYYKRVPNCELPVNSVQFCRGVVMWTAVRHWL